MATNKTIDEKMSKHDNWQRIRTSISDYVVRGDPPLEVALLLEAFPGAGKTTNVLAELMRLEQPFIYLAPDHDVILENLTFHMDDYLGGFIHLQGRRHLCAVPERREYAENFGMPIKPFCSTCEYKKDGSCEYYRRRRTIEHDNPPSWAGVHAHITTYLRRYLFGSEDVEGHHDDFDIIVIEENPIRELMRTVNLQRNDMALMEGELANFTFGNAEQQDLLTIMLDYFITRINRRFNYDLVWRNFVQEWRNFSREQWQDFKDEFDAHLVRRIINEGLQRVPVDIILLLDDILTTTTREMLPYHIMATRKSDYPVISLSYFYGDALHDLPMHVVGLDGTANMDVWRMVLSKDVRGVRITHSFENVYQLSQGSYPAESWIYKGHLRDTGESLLHLLGLIMKSRAGTVLLIGSKRLKPYVESYLKEKGLNDNAEYAWYYNLRSKNFNYCDTVVLLMKPGPPRQQIDVYTHLSGWPDAERIWKEHYVKDEMIQAMARIRPNLKEVSDVFGNPRERDRVEIFVFSKEEIFADEQSVKEGSYYFINKTTMEYFLRMGISSPVHLTRNDIAVEERILQILGDYEERTYNEIRDIIAMPRVVKRCLARMIHFKKLYYHGGKYGIV